MNVNYEITNHACTRMQQRGVPIIAIDYVLENFDKSEFVGSGCQEKWISRRRLTSLRKNGEKSRLLDRAAGVAVIISGDNTIVTIYHKTERTRHKKSKQHKFQNTFQDSTTG